MAGFFEMRLQRALPVLIALAAVFMAVPSTATAQEVIEEAVASPEAIVNAAYSSLDRAPGETYDWELFRSLFLPDAKLIPSVGQTGGELRVLSPDEFIQRVDNSLDPGNPDDKGFREAEIHSIVERYGNVAHVFSTYESFFWEEDDVIARGINSFQLVHHDDRWWIVGIVWDDERGAGPIPDAYRP